MARSAALAGILNQEPSPPPTPEEVETAITQRRDRVEKVWGSIEDYIIGLTCPALHFTITNVAESFLHDLRVVISFAGTHGAEKLQADHFEHEKLLDPDYERPLSMYESTVYTEFKPKGYPVEWKNKDSGLEVRITLPELPPGEAFEWSGDNYDDVVLIATSDEPIPRHVAGGRANLRNPIHRTHRRASSGEVLCNSGNRGSSQSGGRGLAAKLWRNP